MFKPLLFLVALLQVIPAVELPSGVSGLEDQPVAVSPQVATVEQKEAVGRVASQISILCYHDFSAKYEATEMRIRENAFAKQMQVVKDSGVNVISMAEFTAWKQGQVELPQQNVMITIDDGWRSVYLVAYPILKQYEFPFTLGLYNDFIANGDLSLSNKMIDEMLENGMTIASHSVSHPFPSAYKKKRKQGEAEYTEFLKTEIGESKVELEKQFQQSVRSYIYPGGYYTEDMFPVLRTHGYEYAFSVKPGKVTLDSKDLEIPRYVVLGTTDRVFEAAMTFDTIDGSGAFIKELSYPVKPLPGVAIGDRLPWIGVDFTDATNIDLNTVYMRVSGFGLVKAKFLKGTKRFEWQAMRPLRLPSYNVLVQWQLKDSDKFEEPLKWTFRIDHKPEYLKAAEGR